MSKCENLIHNHILYTLQNISTLTTNCFENNLVRNYYNYFFLLKLWSPFLSLLHYNGDGVTSSLTGRRRGMQWSRHEWRIHIRRCVDLRMRCQVVRLRHQLLSNFAYLQLQGCFCWEYVHVSCLEIGRCLCRREHAVVLEQLEHEVAALLQHLAVAGLAARARHRRARRHLLRALRHSKRL